MNHYDETDYDKWRRRWLEVEDVAVVAKEFGVPVRTIYYRRKVDNWDGVLEQAERQVAQKAAIDCGNRKADLHMQTERALSHALAEVERTKAQRIDQAANAALDLGKLKTILEGKVVNGEQGQRITLQTLILLATGSEAGRIASDIKDTLGPSLLPAGNPAI